MGFESSFSIYKTYNRPDCIISNELFQKISENYRKNSLDNKDNVLPIVIDRSYGSETYDHMKKEWIKDFETWNNSDINCVRDRYYVSDSNICYHKADLLNEFNFISNFSALYEKLKTRNNDYMFSISVNEAKKMLAAAKYLLNGNFDKKLESILDNEYISVFGSEYSAYKFQKKNRNIYLEKICRGEYRITVGDPEGDAEFEEDAECYRYVLERVKLAMELFISMTDDNYDKGINYVLVYSVSY